MSEKFKLALGRVENIVGKGENAGFQHFLLFPQCFPLKRRLSQGRQKSGLSGKEFNRSILPNNILKTEIEYFFNILKIYPS